MNRRNFISNASRALVAGTLVTGGSHPVMAQESSPRRIAGSQESASRGHDLNRHRFGVNYTPSKNWWFCWNDWSADPIQQDLDRIASLGADHLRIMLIWPYFQPNPTWISSVHLERLDQLLSLMGERSLDAVVTVFTGQLSGWFFLPPFNKPGTAFYSDHDMWAAQELFIRRLARVMGSHANVLGFDFGNEMNTCWSTEPRVGDAWMAAMYALMETVHPQGIHVNGVDQNPWFQSTTFSPQALAALPLPTMHCYPFWSGALKYGGPMDPPSTRLLVAMATLIRSYAGDSQKPVWAEEFNTCIENLTEKQQAKWLEESVLSAIDSGVGWFTYWDSHDVDRKFKFNSLEYNLGLFTNDGKIKDQGRIFKQLADSYREKPVRFPSRAIPPSPAHPTHDTSWQWMLDWMGWKPANSRVSQ